MRRFGLAIALLAACGDNVGAPDAVPIDADPQPPRCGPAWHLGFSAVDAIMPHDPAPITAGRSYRLVISFGRPACGLIAGLQIATDDAGYRYPDGLVWSYDGDCYDPALGGDRILVVETEREEVHHWVYGEEPGGIPPYIYDEPVGPALATDCDHSRTPCLVDCDCELGEHCLGFRGPDGPTTACGRPCDDPLDCDVGVCGITPEGLDHVCVDSPQCDADDPCPAGSTCVGGDCVPQFEVGLDPPACGCDAECAEGLRCVEYGLPPMRCYATCTADAQCPPSAPCVGGLCGGGRS